MRKAWVKFKTWLRNTVLSWFWEHLALNPAEESLHAYEVRVVRYTTKTGQFAKLIYSGDNLFQAKQVFYSEPRVPHCKIELYTRGHHTASR